MNVNLVLKDVINFINDISSCEAQLNYADEENKEELCIIRLPEGQEDSVRDMCGHSQKTINIDVLFFTDGIDKDQPTYYEYFDEIESNLSKLKGHKKNYNIFNAKITTPGYKGIEPTSGSLVYLSVLTVGIDY